MSNFDEAKSCLKKVVRLYHENSQLAETGADQKRLNTGALYVDNLTSQSIATLLYTLWICSTVPCGVCIYILCLCVCVCVVCCVLCCVLCVVCVVCVQ